MASVRGVINVPNGSIVERGILIMEDNRIFGAFNCPACFYCAKFRTPNRHHYHFHFQFGTGIHDGLGETQYTEWFDCRDWNIHQSLVTERSPATLYSTMAVGVPHQCDGRIETSTLVAP